MVKIATYVFFDIETTGLPHLERNRTKITELSFVAVLRKDLEEARNGSRPFVSKLTLLVNPQKQISPEVEMLTGITNEMLKNAPILNEKCDTILTFLKELPEPVCLVAHNGYNFDYKILLAEFQDMNVSLPKDLLCVDSLVGFRRMHKEKYPLFIKTCNNNNFEDPRGSEDWPDLNVSCEEWDEIDKLCSSFSEINTFEISQESINCSASSTNSVGDTNEKMSFKLTCLYEKICKKPVINTHRAEDDCLMLLECVIAAKEFLVWTDKYCKCIHDIKPLERL